MSTPKNLLVTGGCGFIGSNFINFAFDFWPQCRIVNVDKLILNSDVNYVAERVRTSGRYELVLADIKNRSVISDVLLKHQVCCTIDSLIIIVNKQIDTVIHFAADCTSTRCYGDPCEATENNVFAFIELLEATRAYGKLQRFVHISTDEV